MSDLTVSVQQRESTGKNESRRLRKEGFIPGILYGEKKDPVALVIERRVIDRILHSSMGINTVFDLAMTGTDRKRSVMVKDYQLDPVTDRLIHVDFVRIDATHVVHVPVHIELQGVAIGVKLDGGILEFTLREITVTSLPKDIPASLPLDVSSLRTGQMLRVSDLVLPEGVTTNAAMNAVVCAVHEPKAEAGPAEGATPAADAAATPAKTEGEPKKG